MQIPTRRTPGSVLFRCKLLPIFLPGNGIREYRASHSWFSIVDCDYFSPILTFIILLLLPSSLTLATLLIHRVRAARAARRERAPEDIVNNLPWAVWTGSKWEKHEGLPPHDGKAVEQTSPGVDLEAGGTESTSPEGQTSPGAENNLAGNCSSEAHRREFTEMPWFEVQTECAICLSEFVKGDRVRVLPCQHVFHLEEVDEWLIQRKKLVRTHELHLTWLRVDDCFSYSHVVPRVQSRRYSANAKIPLASIRCR